MARLYVLDVPEFRPLLDAARTKGDLKVHGPKAGYFAVEGETIRIARAETGLHEALWFGALTAGFQGTLAIDSDKLQIATGAR